MNNTMLQKTKNTDLTGEYTGEDNIVRLNDDFSKHKRNIGVQRFI